MPRKTNIERKFRFGNAPLQSMVALGATTPKSFRLWIRAEKPGKIAVRWRPEANSGPFDEKEVDVMPDNPTDNTLGVTIGNAESPLKPMTRYRYRVIESEGGHVIGDGTVETAPGDATSTPERFSVAVMSCNQPFSDDGSVIENADQMLRAARKCLRKHNTKFVLMIGDQMYADMPHRSSLFNPEYFKRIGPEGKDSILNCSADDVRRLYQNRYRHFWNLPGWYEIHREFPCYMMWDDHDIVDNWGSAVSHQEPGWVRVLEGARRAFMDYQGSLVHENGAIMPDSFDFGIRYGSTAVYVLDIRTNRRAGKYGRIYSPDQAENLRKFLEKNGDADVLLFVLTVPVIHLPKQIAKLAARLSPEQEDFSDRWSSGAHIADRDRLLRLLNRHQLLHPHQMVALLSGDIHIGCVHCIDFGSSSIYQMISSAVTHVSGPLVRIGSKLLIRANRTFETSDRTLCGKIEFLERDGPGKNPYGGLNVGIVEISQTVPGDRSRIRFYLYGHKKEQPVCVYRSGLLVN